MVVVVVVVVVVFVFFVVVFVSAFTTWFDVNTLSSAERNLAGANGSFAHRHVCPCDSHW